jgi:hypothetical protein
MALAGAAISAEINPTRVTTVFERLARICPKTIMGPGGGGRGDGDHVESRSVTKRDAHVVDSAVDQERVARLFRRYDPVALPGVVDRGRLLGRIMHDVVTLFSTAR